MNKPYRTSPLESVIAVLQPVWTDVNRMRVPLLIGNEDGMMSNRLGLVDLSFLLRFGLKGPMAAEWLSRQGVKPPARINSWEELEGGGIIARLGSSEFFIEDGLNGNVVAELRTALGRGAPGVAPVFRQDAAMGLTGSEVNSLLVQTCGINFNGFGMDQRQIVMTSMTGVSVLVIRNLRDGKPLYRIWCDGTFGPYLWKTLLQISEELGGAAIGINSLFSEAAELKTLSL